MIIDTHSHLNFKEFDKDREELIKTCLDNNVWIINIGTDLEDSLKAVEMTRKGVYASVGNHPLNVKEGDFFDYEHYWTAAIKERAVAIGETGLDYFYERTEIEIERQKDFFMQHIHLAEEAHLPLVIHCRKAFDDVYDILKKKELRGVLHCFTGNKKDLKKFLDMGYYIGINGIIYKMNLEEVIKEVPLERMLLETDCPFLTPPDFKEKRNNPLGVLSVAETVSKVKGIDIEELKEITTNNARVLFNIFE